MTLTRRQFLAGMGGLAALPIARPLIGRAGMAFGAAAVDPNAAARNRVVLIFLSGGNDGLNMVVPTGDVSGAPRRSVYQQVRPTLAYGPAELLALDRGGDSGQMLGLNPKLPVLHSMYRDGRVAVVQGVDYPDHNYSHFTSTDIWQSGEPGMAIDSGWLGRHLDRAGVAEGELRAVGVGYDLPLALTGRDQRGGEITSIAATRFSDGASSDAAAGPRHVAFGKFSNYPTTEPLRHLAGAIDGQTVTLVNTFENLTTPTDLGEQFANDLLAARILLEQNLGVECVFVSQAGYDTHTTERSGQEALFTNLDAAIDLFFHGTFRGNQVVPALAPDLASRTLLMTFSEFGRRIGENGGAGVAGTDHGAAAPLFLIGPPADAAIPTKLVGGLHGDHPNLGTTAAPADNLVMTTDVRRVYQAVLEKWLHDPDPLYGTNFPALAGLFA
jgi:uncharacterized protein (DUF1501 family)